MKDRLEKLMKKKGEGKEMHPIEREAKLKSLGELRKMAEGMLGEKLGGLKKVTVAAPDKAGLEEGLHTAAALVKKPLSKSLAGKPEAFAGEETPEEEATEEAVEEEQPEEAHMLHDMEALSEEEIDEKIQELMEKKALLAAKK